MKSNIWLRRQLKDPFVKKAQKSGFLSRAAFKLIEIENRYKVITKSHNILELGSAPGGWSQVVLKINKSAKIDAFDLLNMKFKHKNINFIKQDFLNFDFRSLNKKYDLILCDLLPNSSGHKLTDHLKISTLIKEIYEIINFISNKKSDFVFKILKGKEEKEILSLYKKKYEKIEYFKPVSSRKNSSEIYIVAQNFTDN